MSQTATAFPVQSCEPISGTTTLTIPGTYSVGNYGAVQAPSGVTVSVTNTQGVSMEMNSNGTCVTLGSGYKSVTFSILSPTVPAPSNALFTVWSEANQRGQQVSWSSPQTVDSIVFPDGTTTVGWWEIAPNASVTLYSQPNLQGNSYVEPGPAQGITISATPASSASFLTPPMSVIINTQVAPSPQAAVIYGEAEVASLSPSGQPVISSLAPSGAPVTPVTVAQVEQTEQVHYSPTPGIPISPPPPNSSAPPSGPSPSPSPSPSGSSSSIWIILGVVGGIILFLLIIGIILFFILKGNKKKSHKKPKPKQES